MPQVMILSCLLCFINFVSSDVYLYGVCFVDATKNRYKKTTLLGGFFNWRPLGDSNPCYRRERAVS